MSRRCLILPMVVLGLAAGCGASGPKKAQVSGTVTLDGQPLDQGEIYFVTPGAGTPPEILKVVDGRFEGAVTLGKKRVEIHSAKKMPKSGGMAIGPDLVLNRVDEAYNVHSQLTAEVTANGLDPSAFAAKSNPAAR